jgi:hypothetical protein
MRSYTISGSDIQIVEVPHGMRGPRGLVGDKGEQGEPGNSLQMRGQWSSIIQYGPLDVVVAPASASSAMTSLYAHRSGPAAPVGQPPAAEPSFWSEVGIGDLGLSIGGVWRVRQVGHGFTRVGTPVTASNGIYSAARANLAANAAVAVVREIVDADTLVLQSDGFIPSLDPLLVLDPPSVGWEDGAHYWLSKTAGRLVAAEPDAAVSQIVYRITRVNGDDTADAVVVLTNDLPMSATPSPDPAAAISKVKIDDVSGDFDGATRQFAMTAMGQAVDMPVMTEAVRIHIDGNEQEPFVDFTIIDNGAGAALIDFTEAPAGYETFWGIYTVAFSAGQAIDSGATLPDMAAPNTLFYLTAEPNSLYIYQITPSGGVWVPLAGDAGEVVSLSMSGLTNGLAVPGNHASIEVPPPAGVTFEFISWGVGTFGDDTYGSATNPDDYAAGDGQALLFRARGDNLRTYQASAPIRYEAAVNTVPPVLSGGTGLGDTLSITNGTWTGAVGGAFERTIQRNDGGGWVDLPDPTYEITLADSGVDFRAVEAYPNSGGSPSATSNVVTVDTFAAPQFSVAPTATLDGRTLTITTGTATGDPTPDVTLQLLADDGAAIVDITPTGPGPWVYEAPTSPEDVTLLWRVRATNAVTPFAEVSGSVFVGADLFAPSIGNAPTLSGPAQVGKQVTATRGPVTANPAATPSTEWRRDGVVIPGSIGLAYTFVPADEGAAITYAQIETNAYGVDIEVSLPTALVAPSSVVLAMAGLAGGVAALGDHASINVPPPSGVTFVSEAWGVGTYGDSTYGTASSPSDYAASDAEMLLWEGIGDDGLTYRASAQVRKPLAVPGAALDLSFQEGIAATQDLLASWTLNDNALTFVSSVPVLPAGVSVTSGSVLSVSSAAAAIADASYNLNFEDEYGAVVTGVAIIEITAEPVVSDPVISSSVYNPPGAGGPSELDVEGQYPEGGTDTLTLYGVTLSGAITPDGSTEAQIIAGSGVANALEYFSVPGVDFAVGRYPVTGLTAASEATTHIAYVIAEDNDGGSSGVQVISGVTGMDFTPAAFTSAEVGNINDTTLRIVFDGPMYGSIAPTDLVLTGNTIAAVDFTPGDDFVDVTLGTAVTSSDDYTGDLSYVGSDLTDDAAVPFPTFASQNVTNNVSAPAPTGKFEAIPAQISRSFTGNPSFTLDLSNAVAGDRVVIWYGNANEPTAVTLGGEAMSVVTDASTSTASGQRILCYEIVLGEDGTASETLALTVGTTNMHMVAGCITNRVIAVADTDVAINGASASLSITPLSADNDVVAVAMGEKGTEGLTSWVGVTEQSQPTRPDGNSSGVGIATAADVAAAATTVGVSPVVSGGLADEDTALSVIVLEDA